MKGSEELIEVDPGATASPGEAGPLADSPIPSPRHSNDDNTAEIPRPDDDLSPSRRHIDANGSVGPLTNVQINVIDAEELMSAPGTVEVVGQIAGPGVRHAGIYVNGRLVRQIPISAGAYSAFDLTFPMPAGSDARIRAYGNGNDFVEASVDTVGGGAGMTEYRNPPMYAAPYGTYPAYPPSPYTESLRLRESLRARLQSLQSVQSIRDQSVSEWISASAAGEGAMVRPTASLVRSRTRRQLAARCGLA